jgi:hypothetical protein
VNACLSAHSLSGQRICLRVPDELSADIVTRHIAAYAFTKAVDVRVGEGIKPGERPSHERLCRLTLDIPKK